MASMPCRADHYSAARNLKAATEQLAEAIRAAHKALWPGDVPIDYSVRQDRDGDVTVKIDTGVNHDPASAQRRAHKRRTE
jgi:hypothetical protein